MSLRYPKADILLVEDSSADVLLVKLAVKQARWVECLHVVEDGERAIDFLRRRGPHFDAPRPHLILLDLNLPRKDGFEVLADIKADPSLCMIPVVVLTTSGAERDIARAYGLHANCFIIKQPDFKAFQESFLVLEEFWFEVARLAS